MVRPYVAVYIFPKKCQHGEASWQESHWHTQKTYFEPRNRENNVIIFNAVEANKDDESVESLWRLLKVSFSKDGTNASFFCQDV